MGKFKGIIAAGHNTTADVAAEILREGGNAFDAAVGALLVSFISEPCMSSPGGGGFANIHSAGKAPKILDFFCQTPKLKLRPEKADFYPFTIDFGGTTEDFYIGHASHAVPGMVAGIFDLHRQYGSMPMNTLVEPAIQAAKEGVEVDPFQYLDLVLLEDMIRKSEKGISLYLPKGKLLQIGEQLYMPNLAGFLDMLRYEGPREFYEGEIARTITNAAKEHRGQLRMPDFKDYRAIFRNPIKVDYKGSRVHTTTFPSLGGAVIALGLGELDKIPSPKDSHLSARHIERLLPVLETMEHTTRKPEILAAKMEMYENILFSKKWGSTTHFGIQDGQGNAISVTISNGEGSGYIIPGTDCFMNNMLGEAALLPEGFFSWKEDTRLFSLMSPTIVLNKKGQTETIIGTGGAGRIPGAIIQVLHYLMDYGMDVDTAVHAPRMHISDDTLNVEPGHDGSADTKHFKASYWDEQNLYFGGVHTITSLGGSIRAAGDRRRYGVTRRVE